MTIRAIITSSVTAVLVLATPIATKAAESWSALAVSSEAYGTAKGARSQIEAEKQAVAACNQRSRKDACAVRAFTLTKCGAIASWSYLDRSYRQFGHLASFGDSLKMARAQALDDCRKRHRGCRISIALCNG